jgi:hypothetical protein
MASTCKQSILQIYPQLRRSIQLVQQDVLGYFPPAVDNMRTGYQQNKRQLKAVYLNQYYEGHPSIKPSVRKVRITLFLVLMAGFHRHFANNCLLFINFCLKVIPGWKDDKEERREQKLHIMRRNGKGPPKKGAGKKGKKKGGK